MQRKWYESSGATILFLFLFFPIGLFLMWKYCKWNKAIKIIITSFFVLVFARGFISSEDTKEVSINNPDTKETTQIKETVEQNKIETKRIIEQTQTKERETTKILKETEESTKPYSKMSREEIIITIAGTNDDTILMELKNALKVLEEKEKATEIAPTEKIYSDIEYKIYKEEDSSFGNVIRKDLRVLINYTNNMEIKEIENLFKKVVNDYTTKNKVNALTVFLFDDENDADGAFTIGRCGYYPDGDIGNAQNVKSGDYKTFTYTFDINERDGSNIPTDKEIEIYTYLNVLLAGGDGSLEFEDECDKLTAEKFNITEDEVTEIWIKVYSYKH